MKTKIVMKIDYRAPSEKVKDLVVQYELIDSGKDQVDILDRHIPSGYASFVFNLSGRAIVHEEPPVLLPRFFGVLPLFRSVKIGLYSNFDSFIVTCKASVLSRLLNMSFIRSKDRYYHCLDDERLKEVEKAYLEEQTAEQRIAIIEDYFEDKGLVHYHEDDIDLFYNQIMSGKGMTSIADLIEWFDRSPRYFRHHFNERVGVNAKTLARIVRVNYLWSMIIKNQAVDFQDMVFEGNYFDQAHLIHDFKKMVGETPSFFFQRNLEKVMLISGKR